MRRYIGFEDLCKKVRASKEAKFLKYDEKEHENLWQIDGQLFATSGYIVNKINNLYHAQTYCCNDFSSRQLKVVYFVKNDKKWAREFIVFSDAPSAISMLSSRVYANNSYYGRTNHKIVSVELI